MNNRRARTYAVCAVKLDEDHTDAAEGTFDAALTNALVAIVADEWPGEERWKPDDPKSKTKPASALLILIRERAEEGSHLVKRADEPDVFLIRDPHADEDNGEVAESSAEEASVMDIFSGPKPELPHLETQVDVGTLLDAVLNVTQPVRHAREDGGAAEGEPRVLERRHVEALLALDDHPSLLSLDMEREDRYEDSAQQQDAREMKQAGQTLERIGGRDGEEAKRRAAAAEDLHPGPVPGDPGALGIQECPVCEYEAFSSDGEDELCMHVGYGECLVCHYRRSPAIANALARDVEDEARGDRD